LINGALKELIFFNLPDDMENENILRGRH
jgi:hypothetical protein